MTRPRTPLQREIAEWNAKVEQRKADRRMRRLVDKLDREP